MSHTLASDHGHIQMTLKDLGLQRKMLGRMLRRLRLHKSENFVQEALLMK
jgi:hypothetical protein